MSVCLFFRLSVRPHWTTQHPLNGFSRNLVFCVFFGNLSRKFTLHSNLATITNTLHKDQYTFVIISRSVLLRMRYVFEKSCRRNENTCFIFNNSFLKSFLFWVNVKKFGRNRQATDDNIIWRMCFACWMTKARDTHSEYVILIAFPRQ